MFGRLFLDHPRSVDESYFEHLLFAGGFALRLLGQEQRRWCTRWSRVCSRKQPAI